MNEVYPNERNKNISKILSSKLEFRYLKSNVKLFPYQEFVRRYLSPYTPYKFLVLYHSLGSGKTIACISVAVDHMKADGKNCVIITKGLSSENNFKLQIEKYEKLINYKMDPRKIKYYHFIQLSNIIRKRQNVKNILSNSIVIIDEIHNLRGIENEGTVMNVCKAIKCSEGSKFLFCTATPMINSPEELTSLLCFAERTNFNEKINGNWEEYFRGIVSYSKISANKPRENIISNDESGKYYVSYMKGIQKETYKKSVLQDHQKMYGNLIQISLFCTYKNIEEAIFGDELKQLLEKKYITKTTKQKSGKTKQIKYGYYSFKSSFEPTILEDLENYSCIYKSILDIINKTHDKKIFIFLEYVMGSGIILLSSLLQLYDFELYVEGDIQKLPKKKRYTFCVGDIELCSNLNERIDSFNDPLNMNGEYIQVLIGSKIIGESINLYDVYQFHYISQHWNYSVSEQAKGRVIREGSHKKNNSEIDIYVHVASTGENQQSIDEYKISISESKQKKIREVEQILADTAIDKYLYSPITNIEEMDIYTFVALYAQDYVGDYTEIIWENVPCSIKHLQKQIKLSEDFVSNSSLKERICKEFSSEIIRLIIVNNIKIKNKYLRCFFDDLYFTEDKSIPFYGCKELEYSHYKINKVEQDKESSFRWLPVEEKIELLERGFTEAKIDLLKKISTLYIEINNKVYHFLEYKISDKSYSACVPVPPKPLNKTRVFNGKSWEYVTKGEREIINKARKCYEQFLYEKDKSYSIYGYISVIDGSIRLRLSEQCDSSNIKDKRKIKRGKSIKSYTVEELCLICTYLGLEQQKQKKNMISSIEKYLLKNNLFCFL